MGVLFDLIILGIGIYLLVNLGKWRGRTALLEKEVRELQQQMLQQQLLQRGSAPPLPEAEAAPPEVIPIPVQERPPEPERVPEPPPDVPLPEPERAPEREPEPAPPPRPSLPPAQPPAWLLAAKQWLFSGNLVAKIGLLILFIGVSFLLKYAAERVTLPIELRLAGVVVADIGLLIFGWRIRLTRRGISLPVQGAALGILMLVTFAAFKRFELIPGGLAFGLLFVLTFFTCLLAVLQNAFWLAVFGIAGGFLAPIMTSTGQGSHVALFSYYALLNGGILAIALKRSWRALNLLGFAFTFVIGSYWGVLRYVPENYLSAQLFLILFVAFYVAIAVAYAARQATGLKNYVDATLVFGVPLAAFGLQYGLVKDTQFGLAYAALGFGLFYTSLALVLWRRGAASFKLLVESFVSLGVVFGTLALPFALDGRWTSAAWALEGAGVVWIGLRQRQPLAVLFGLLVQFGAWISFIGAAAGIDSAREAASANLWLGFLLLAGTAFLMASNLRKNGADMPRPLPVWAAGAFLGVATLWLLGGAWTEVLLRYRDAMLVNLLAISAVITALILGLIASRMEWRLARTLSVGVQFVTGVPLLFAALFFMDQGRHGSLFDTAFLGALMVFAGALFSAWAMQRIDPEQHGRTGRMLTIWSGFWWFGPVLMSLVAWLAARLQPDAASIYIYGVATSALLFAFAARRLAWAFLRWLSASGFAALAGMSVLFVLALYGGERPDAWDWLAYLAIWASSEYLMRRWPANGWNLSDAWLRVLHSVRTVAPWLMLWPALGNLVTDWLAGAGPAQAALLQQSGFASSGSWSRYLPAWLMMLAIVWLIGRVRAEAWPTRPVTGWHRQVLVPLATAWSLLLVVVWNLTQDGAMAPLPYVPVLNPLDLTSGFALLLAVACYRIQGAAANRLRARAPAALGIAAYAWFNLMLLRTSAYYMEMPHRFDVLFDSQFVQAMLSLVWSVTALILMRRAARIMSRPLWIAGAVLLGLVCTKLFLVDLSDVGGVARIVSFVGVGLLMVLIGYLAPLPTQKEEAAP